MLWPCFIASFWGLFSPRNSTILHLVSPDFYLIEFVLLITHHKINYLILPWLPHKNYWQYYLLLSWVFFYEFLVFCRNMKKVSCGIAELCFVPWEVFWDKKGACPSPLFITQFRLVLHFGAWFYWPLDYNLQLKVSKSQKKWSNQKNESTLLC